MAALGISNRQLAVKSGVSDRLIGMYKNRDSVPSMDKAEKIAKALGFELWQLQMPDFDPAKIDRNGLSKIYRAYLLSDKAGRSVMETQAEYVISHKPEATNDSHTQKKPNSSAS